MATYAADQAARVAAANAQRNQVILDYTAPTVAPGPAQLTPLQIAEKVAADKAAADKVAEKVAADKAAADKAAADKAASDKAAADKAAADKAAADKAAADKAAADKAAAQTSAADALSSILSSYGLTGGIAGGVTALLQNGLDIATIQTILDSPDPSGALKGLGLTPTQLSSAQGLVSSWQQRFSGNQARISAGLNPLSPAEYIANEQSYKQVMAMAGIPSSSPLMSTDYLGKLMGTDVSPAEVQMRVNAATATVNNEDPQVLAQLQTQFGMTMPTILTHLLDPSVAAPLVQQEYNAATIGAEAARAGVSIAYGATGPLSAMGLAAQGITQSQANQGFTSIAQQQAAMQSLAGRYQGYGNAEGIGQQLEASTFNTAGAAQAQQNLERLKTQEVSAFSGSAGAATGSLGAKDISGLS